MSYLGRKGASAALTSADIPDGSVTTAKLIDSSVTSAKIGVDVIVAEDIANNAVTVAELADNAVTQAKLADDAVGTAELANDVAISTTGAITTTGAFTSIGIDDNSNALAMTIDSDEKVGIGIAAPDYLLHTKMAANGYGIVAESTDGGEKVGMYFGGSNDAGIGTITSTNLDVFVGGSTKMTIDTSGNLSTSAASQLSSVAGTDFTLYSSTSERSVNSNGVQYQLMRSFYPSRSGSVNLQWEGYIASGSHYWGYRLYGADGYTGNYFYTSNRSTSADVHAWNTYSLNLNVEHGSICKIEFSPATGDGTLINGNGQLIYIKNFYVKATTPDVTTGGT